MKITEAFERGEFAVTAEVGRRKGFILRDCWRKQKHI